VGQRPIRLEELEANLDLVHEVARDTLRRVWHLAEENGIEPADFVKGVAQALSGVSMQITFATWREKSKTDDVSSGREPQPSQRKSPD
jgi:hypothetical protein